MDFGRTDREIMDYLMTSDFSENLTPDESRFLLSKFRYQYRFIHSQMQSDLYKMDEKDLKIEQLTSTVSDLNRTISELGNTIDIYKSRIDKDLSFKERLLGKIKFNYAHK